LESEFNTVRGLINDLLRRLIGASIRSLGLFLSALQRIKISTFCWNQKRLRRRYGITSDTPILSFGPELEQLIRVAAANAGAGAKYALTSGSTSRAKRILYTKRRLLAVKLTYVDFFARLCWSLRIKRTGLFVFSSAIGSAGKYAGKDDSLTSLLLEERGSPPYLSTLQAPYRIIYHPAIQSLISEYGTTAVRLWILAIANPGVLYSTNPSTLSTFFDELASEWTQSSALIRDWCRKPEVFSGAIHKIAGRLQSSDSASRLACIACSDVALPLRVCAPAVEAYVCWVGGYVKPFLDRLAIHLPPERYRLIPMYSMSTETLETVGHFQGNRHCFLPLASKVLYEFIEEGSEDTTQNLRFASQLQEGKIYSMIVSDPHGLRRYQTGDLFVCNEFVSGLPDLHFVRRRNLEYSFTGEKLTAEHVMTAFEVLRAEYPDLRDGKFLTCIPSHPPDECIPHYKIVVVDGAGQTLTSTDELAKRCDELLGEVNHEYKSKHESGRLGPARCVVLSPREFINRTTSRQQSDTWEAQFKFLPLYRRTWESHVEV
jgi:GH3 auxin-responsive promoter